MTPQRPLLWENDIAVNSSGSGVFKNLPPPAEMPQDLFTPGHFLEAHQLLNKTLSEYAQNDRFPLHAAEDREGYNTGHNHAYYVFGPSDYLKLRDCASR